MIAAAAQAYAHPGYAASLAEFGTPRLLPASGGWILERPIPGTTDRDAIGCYPIFTCPDWDRLPDDLEALGRDLVSLAVVVDPFAVGDPDRLRRLFPDRAIPFKDHFVADLDVLTLESLSRHHRYYARKALAQVEVEAADDPRRHLDEWTALYAELTARHDLKGIQAFSRAAFARQLEVPGIVMLRARHAGETVGAHLYYVQGEVATSHLAAASRRGYELMVFYALYWRAVEHFKGRVRYVNFGAGAGLAAGADDGLTRFKRGWATETRTAWFCGRVLDRERYAKILAGRGLVDEGYFPAYRKGEFA